MHLFPEGRGYAWVLYEIPLKRGGATSLRADDEKIREHPDTGRERPRRFDDPLHKGRQRLWVNEPFHGFMSSQSRARESHSSGDCEV